MSITVEPDGWTRPLPEDVCELCKHPFGPGDTVQSYGGSCGTFDDEGRLRRLWAHPGCVNPPPVERAYTPPPRHHDPVVADLLARVEQLEARKK